jgi:hypothetical protein
MVMYKEASDVRRSRVASGLGAVATAGLLAASLGVAPTANAFCASFSGLTIGNSSQCDSSFGSFAIALGTTDSAFAGDTGFSPFNIAISLGGTATVAAAGVGIIDTGLMSIGNFAIASGGSEVISEGLLNLAAGLSFGGPGSGVEAFGVANNAWSLFSSDSFVAAAGFVNHASSLGGSGNSVASASDLSQTGLGGLFTGFNVASSMFGSDNVVVAGDGTALFGGPLGDGNGPLAVAIAIGSVSTPVTQTDFGLPNIKFGNFGQAATVAALNTAAPNELAAMNAGGTGSQSKDPLKKAGKQISASLNKVNKQTGASLNKTGKQISASLNKTGKQIGASLNKVNKQISSSLNSLKPKKAAAASD